MLKNIKTVGLLFMRHFVLVFVDFLHQEQLILATLHRNKRTELE